MIFLSKDWLAEYAKHGKKPKYETKYHKIYYKLSMFMEDIAGEYEIVGIHWDEENEKIGLMIGERHGIDISQ